ncbi:hypothetical protein OCV99_07530 [Dorea acetigenes]|uniref:Nif11 domain-containing protein n=1 Tax=Dorea acetigenes TaxID=2981787 RepID=A0ABT2RM32_9FIRM|nr:hypothetical protein [Dorea acetigenes]MCB6415622.1 hypothetical protein [Faecalimonas umbilicata]MCU6686401.1 hypothetical protein [Dorea acetigenes]SCI93415.1 Uncharacterised protein [uncultured Clostridium sp.]
MADIVGMLDELQGKALQDQEVREKLLATRKEKDPVSAFCRVCRELGYELYEMELICAGEEFHAAMKRSTNGGGENSPMLSGEDDFYELFFASIENS